MTMAINSNQAEFSDCGKYRYLLDRDLGPGATLGTTVFVMLNPSLADGERNDPTLIRCMKFAHGFGFKTLMVVNCFAYITPHPKDLREVMDPVGKMNHTWIQHAIDQADGNPVICAWGSNEKFTDQYDIMKGWLKDARANTYALKITKDGFPHHPLYLPKHTKPMEFEL